MITETITFKFENEEQQKRLHARLNGEEEGSVEAVAKALMDECYGSGSWDRIAHMPAGVGQVHGFKQQARAAIKVMQDWM